MEATLSAAMVWIMLLTVILGSAGTIVARICLTCPLHCLGRVFFFTCLVLVGLGTFAAMLTSSSLWLTGGAMLAIMAVGSTWEVGRLRESPAC